MRHSEHRFAFALLLAVTAVWGAILALALAASRLPPESAGTLSVVFPPGMTGERRFLALLDSGGRLVTSTALPWVWVVHSDRPGFVERLEQAGAWAAFPPAVARGIALGGCFLAATDAGVVRAPVPVPQPAGPR